MSNKRVRGKNFTEEESLELLSLTVPFKKIVENKQTNAVTNQEKAAAWQSIKEKYDEAHPLQMRTTQQLMAKYENLKNQARKYAADNKRIVCGTGGGDHKYIKDVVLEAVLELINKKTVYGEVNDFDDDLVMAVPEENVLAEAVNEYHVIDAEVVCAVDEMEVIFNTPSTSHQLPPDPICDPTNTVQKKSAQSSRQKPKFLKKRKGASELNVLADTKAEMYQEKTRLLRLECESKEKENKLKDLQIAMLEDELEERKEGKVLRLSILKEELDSKQLDNKLKRQQLNM